MHEAHEDTRPPSTVTHAQAGVWYGDPVELMEKSSVEPHREILKQPSEDQLLYKIVRAGHFLDMIEKNYLYFKRVDTYRDGDISDGKQLPSDETENLKSGFVKNPSYTLKQYYDMSRSRTYACCFSLENSDHIWENYGSDGEDAICLVFHFGKLRQMLNETIGTSRLMYGDIRCRQFFSINYGIIQYVDFSSHRFNTEYYPNPILYTYCKDKKYESEKELRISLSAFGMGKFSTGDSEINFREALQMQFAFKAAFAQQAITEIKYIENFNMASFREELQRLGIVLQGDK